MKTKPNEGVVENAQVEKSERPPVDFTKQWTNGHKFFTSDQSVAFVELLHTEERTRERHERFKNDATRPRNPINGDPTPRDSRGEAVMNPKQFHTVKINRIPLHSPYDEDLSSSIVGKFTRKEPMGKIGVPEEKFNVLGNTMAPGKILCSDSLLPIFIVLLGNPALAEDLHKTVARYHEKKAEQAAEREKINEYIAREKALRHQKELGRQLKILNRQMEEKQKEMTFIKTQYNL